MANSRRKGASFEREVAAILRDHLGIRFERDLEQYRKNDRGDLIPSAPNFPFLIECKRTAEPVLYCKPAWWAQAEDAAANMRKRPAVIWKADRREIRCTVNLRDVMECLTRQKWSAENHLIELPVEGFCYVAREGLCL